MPRRLTQAEFLSKAIEIHSARYDYSRVRYVNTSTKVEITCPVHGLFEQAPNCHLQKQGCPQCGIASRGKAQRLTKDQFIANAQAAHGAQYDYSQVVYIGNKLKVKIICPTHGVFEQSPLNHVKGQQCPKCSLETVGDKLAISQEQFIAKAHAVHGDKYDYSQTVYTRRQNALNIICRKHGIFKQTAGDHLNGHGCQRCAIEGNIIRHQHTQAEFIERAHAVHGDKYDYSLAVYKHTDEKLKIICPAHGEFQQTPTSHILAGCGCPACGRERTIAGRKHTTNAFIEIARARHGNKYDYSQVVYAGGNKKVKIICPTHGLREQSPHCHLVGYGCSACGIGQTAKALAHDSASFLALAHAVHGDKYDYSLVEYVLSKNKIAIICSKHGVFKQSPHNHINRASGCPTCANELWAAAQRLSWVERTNGRPAQLYFLRLHNGAEQFYKIGITCLGVSRRYNSKPLLGGYQYEEIALYTSLNAAAVYDWEQSILETFAHLRYKPERRFGGETECFSSCEEILSIFPVAG